MVRYPQSELEWVSLVRNGTAMFSGVVPSGWVSAMPMPISVPSPIPGLPNWIQFPTPNGSARLALKLAGRAGSTVELALGASVGGYRETKSAT